MFIKRDLFIVLIALLAAVLIAGCGLAMKESGGDQTGGGDGIVDTAEYVGLGNCYTCHNQTKFNQWMKSRHANFDLEDGTRVDYATMKTAVGGTDVTYDEITGDPDLHPDGSGGDRCAPCHTGADLGGAILDANYYGDVFLDPNIGQMNRPVIGCEACHGGGSFHYGVGALPYPTPGFEPCATLCHDLNFDKETYGAHHFVSSNRDWENAAGDTVRDADSDVTPLSSDVAVIPATTDDPAVIMEVWTLPDPADTVWSGNYNGPYYPVPHEVIVDTHFNAAWISEDDQLTIYSVSTARLGYVNTANNSPNTGMVNSDDEESCTASCHQAHQFDLTINEQWAEGAHHPTPVGPVDVDHFPPDPASWHAVDHEGFSASCQRCHTSMGFAEMAPTSNGSTTETPSDSDGFITCNACHDGVNNPTPADKHLRFTGDVPLFNNASGSVITTVDAGDSAVCVYCHQGREDPSRVTGTSFRNMHYLAAGAVQYAEKGYDYAETYGTYVGPQTAHADTAGNCVGCHMEDSMVDEEIGGHTFHVAHASTDNVTTCDTAGCHAGITSFADITASGDWDGDTVTESAKDEIAGLRTVLLDAIQAADMNPIDGTLDVYHQENYPYFVLNSGQSWSLPLAAAAYNWQYIYKDPGAYAHNGKYAAELLLDSYEDLTGGPLAGAVRP